MRISDFVAAAAFLVAIIGAYLVHRENKRRALPPAAKTSAKITYGPDKKKGKSKSSGEQDPPTLKGIFTVDEGLVRLHSAYFIVRRKSDGEYIELHSFSAEFDPPREAPVVESGHVIHARPLNIERLKASIVGADAIFVEFNDTFGQIYRSPELPIH